jgi:hypothetical protein
VEVDVEDLCKGLGTVLAVVAGVVVVVIVVVVVDVVVVVVVVDLTSGTLDGVAARSNSHGGRGLAVVAGV